MARLSTRLAAGRRDRWVRLEQRPTADTATATGFPQDGAWTTLVAHCPAARIELRGWEKYAASQNSAAVETRWEIGYRGDMDPELVDVPKTRRLVAEDRTYDILSAAVVGRRAGIELWTRAASAVA